MNLAGEIKQAYRKGDVLFRLIYINIVLFVLIRLGFVFYRLFTSGVSLTELQIYYTDNVMKYLEVPSRMDELLARPWTVITYMFAHFSFMHILFNMLVLYWFGRIFMQYLTGRQLLTTYLIGGLAGALLYLIFLNGFPGLRIPLGVTMLGASAAIMAIVVAISAYAPDYTLNLLFIGPVKLKYIALFYIVLDVLMIASDNSGGNIAHLGGAMYGLLFTSQFKKGRDPGKWLNRILDFLFNLFRPRPKLNVTYRKNAPHISDFDYNRNKVAQQKEIDRILDKIARAGYESLTKQEKEILFSMSDKNK
jgi:membrane associated rhomboid family serine protease